MIHCWAIRKILHKVFA